MSLTSSLCILSETTFHLVQLLLKVLFFYGSVSAFVYSLYIFNLNWASYVCPPLFSPVEGRLVLYFNTTVGLEVTFYLNSSIFHALSLSFYICVLYIGCP